MFRLKCFFTVLLLTLSAPAFAEKCDLRIGGSYSWTCRECRVEGSFLRCECERKNHGLPWKTTQIPYKTCKANTISNIDGTLKCEVTSKPCED